MCKILDDLLIVPDEARLKGLTVHQSTSPSLDFADLMELMMEAPGRCEAHDNKYRHTRPRTRLFLVRQAAMYDTGGLLLSPSRPNAGTRIASCVLHAVAWWR